jgi:hypothetical protein
VRIARAREQLTPVQEWVDLGEAPHLARRDASEDVRGPKLGRVGKAGRADQVGQCGQCVPVELAYTGGFVLDDKRPLTPWILGRNAGRYGRTAPGRSRAQT